MTNAPPDPPEAIPALLRSLQGRLRAMTVAVIIMALALMLTAAAVFGSLVNYFAADPLIFGGASMGAAIVGFAFGWIARGRA